jgi:thiosulfate/3-mercaptopyruvate sulfurtransferase
MRARIPFQCCDVRQAETLIRRSDVLIFDVRDPQSFGRAHINDAQHLSRSNLSIIISATTKSRPILIYCYHGNASREYAQMLSDFGFSEVYSLDGGYEAWRNRAPGHAARHEKLQQWLVAQGFPPNNINAVISNGTTPLMQACHQCQSDCMRALIAAGAPLDVRNSDGNNALWLACVGNHLDIIDLLIAAGINMNNRNDNGATPLMYAASSGKADVVGRLLAKGADTAPETLDGFSALDLASTVECLALLRRARGKAPALAAM